MNASSAGSPSAVGSIGTACGCTVRSVVGRVEAGDLEQAAAPADARHLGAGVRGSRRDAVRRDGQVEQGADVRHHLVAALRPGPDDGRRAQPSGELDDRLGDRRRRVRRERLADR